MRIRNTKLNLTLKSFLRISQSKRHELKQTQKTYTFYFNNALLFFIFVSYYLIKKP